MHGRSIFPSSSSTNTERQRRDSPSGQRKKPEEIKHSEKNLEKMIDETS
jgi:hypothetical protein